MWSVCVFLSVSTVPRPIFETVGAMLHLLDQKSEFKSEKLRQYRLLTNPLCLLLYVG